jgi:TrpR-related protein YerC/YecD
MASVKPKDIEELYVAITSLASVDECRRFLGDLMTASELRESAERWKAARMLAAGASYVAIEKETGLSSRTIARVHKWLNEGKGGYALMLRKMGFEKP